MVMNITRQIELLKSFSWLMALRAIQQMLGLIGVYFLARGLETSTFGKYGILLSILAICTILTFPGLNTAVAQCVARGSSSVYRRALLFGVIGGSLGSLVCFSGWFYFRGSDSDLSIGLLLTAFLFPVSHGMLQWQSVLTGKEMFKNVFWIGSLTSVITYTVIIAGLLLYPDELLVPVVAVLAVPALINSLMTVYSLSKTEKEGADELAIKYGIASSGYLAINTIANHLDKLLLFYFLSAEVVAIYMVAERLSDLAKSVVQDFSAVLSPRFARLSEYTRRIDFKLKLLGLLFSAVILLLTFTILPWVLVVIFSEKYVDAIPVAQGLMVSVAIGIHATLRARYVTSKLDSVSVRDIYVTISIARIVFTFILVPLFGVWGAVGSAICYRVVSNILVHLVIIKRYLPKRQNV